MSTNEVRYDESPTEEKRQKTILDMQRPGSLVGVVYFAVSEELLRDAKADTLEGERARYLIADDVRKRVLSLLKTAPV